MTNTSAKPGIWTMVGMPLGLAAVMTPAILLAASGNGAFGSGGFDAVVHGIESRYHTHATKIPFMGLVSCIAGIATHGGVHGLHVAEIENLQGPVDGTEFNALVEQKVGPGWQRMIRETSRDGGEQNLIYARPEGERLGMLIVDLNGHELDIVQISVNPDQLSNEIAKHRHSGDKPVTESDEKDESGSSQDY